MSKFAKFYFNKLYDKLFCKISGYVVSKCTDLTHVEDIVQEIFFELYSVIEKKGTGYIKNPEAFCFRIAKFKIAKYYSIVAKLKNQVANLKISKQVNAQQDLLVEHVEIEDSLINHMLLEEVWKTLNKKPLDTQKIFVLHYNLGLTIKEIAVNLNKSESFVKHRLYRTLEEIRKIYKKED